MKLRVLLVEAREPTTTKDTHRCRLWTTGTIYYGCAMNQGMEKAGSAN